jgi:hypothetical protein
MKKHVLVVLGCALAAVLLFAPALSAAEPGSPDQAKLNLSLIKENIAVGLGGGIPGVQADLAQLVRDLKDLYPDEDFESLTIPLMAVMHDESAETPVRIIAALALDRVESAIGDFAISQMSRFADNSHLQYICAALTQRRMKGSLPPGRDIAVIDPLPEDSE